MRVGCKAGWCALAVSIALLCGCRTAGREAALPLGSRVSRVAPAPPVATASESALAGSAIERASARLTVPADSPGSTSAPVATVHLAGADDATPAVEAPLEASPRPAVDATFMGGELQLTDLEQAVLARNQSLQAAAAAAHAAAERAPQVSALEDPLFQSMYAPQSFTRNSHVQSSYYLGVAQKIPWRGKLALRGEQAEAERNAVCWDFQDVQLRLREMTRIAYFDYFLVRREQAINAANRERSQEFRDSAQSRYENNLVTQQDVLQAEVELATLERRGLELARSERVAVARINTLLHRAPAEPLPPPPAELPVSDTLPAPEYLQQVAVESRPDLSALASRIQAERAAWGLACKEFYPDFELMGRYDQFWTDIEQRGQVGLNVNVPLNQSRRRAGVREALLRITKLQAEYNQQRDTIANEVEAAHARLDESRQAIKLYQTKILPAAESNVESASAGYTAGQVDFLRLIEAQRELIRLREEYYETIADYHRRSAELERAVGAPFAVPSAVAPVPIEHVE